MNGRAPEYKKCNEITLVWKCDGVLYFRTFWKNVHQQFLLTGGTVNGCTYTVTYSNPVTKEDGNACYVDSRKHGWVKWEQYCKENNLNCLLYDLGRVLI